MNADQIKANKPKNHRIQWLCYTSLQGSSDFISVSNVEKNKKPSRRKETEKKKMKSKSSAGINLILH